MNTDFRLAVGYLKHPKIVKLKRRFGAEGVLCHQSLLAYTAVYKPDGALTHMSIEDIEIAADWEGDAGAFVAVLVEIKLLDVDGDVFLVHDWEEHNPWAAGADERKKKASKAAKARWGDASGEASNATHSNGQCYEHDLVLPLDEPGNAPLLSSPFPPSPNEPCEPYGGGNTHVRAMAAAGNGSAVTAAEAASAPSNAAAFAPSARGSEGIDLIARLTGPELGDAALEFGDAKEVATNAFRQDRRDPHEVIMRQLDYWPHRKPNKSPRRFLLDCIVGDYGPPKEWLAAQKEAEARQRAAARRAARPAPRMAVVAAVDFDAAWAALPPGEQTALTDRALDDVLAESRFNRDKHRLEPDGSHMKREIDKRLRQIVCGPSALHSRRRLPPGRARPMVCVERPRRVASWSGQLSMEAAWAS